MLGSLTSVNRLIDGSLNGTLICSRHRLLRDRTAAIIEAFRLVHSSLKSITFPTKHIIGMRASRNSLKAPNVRVLGTRCPHVVELAGIPHGFEGYLWHADWMRWGTCGSVGEAVEGNSVVHVRLMIGAVEIFTCKASQYAVESFRGRSSNHPST